MNHSKSTSNLPEIRKKETFTQKCWAFEGVITYIHWGDGIGTVDIGSNPDLGESGEVDCEFRYMGQHWLANLNAYPDTDAGMHSAYAFCQDDLVIVISMPLPPEEGTETKKRKYVCVAILEEDRSAVKKRWVWPLFQELPNVVLGATYTDPGQEAGFPFISPYNSRQPVEPFIDMRGNERPLGTLGGDGNTRLVITRELLDDEPIFIPHAAYEFMTVTDGFDYVPDVLMQTQSNYRGRTVGFSAEDEILIDNIPIAKVFILAYEPGGSDRSSTHRLVHIDEVNDIITVLYVTMDFHFAYYTNHPIYEEAGYFPPPYSFHVRKAQLIGADLCVYKAMNLETIPEIILEVDAEASQTWDQMLGKPYQRNEPYCRYTWAHNLQQSYAVAYAGKTVELKFWGSVFNYNDDFQEIKFILSTYGPEDGEELNGKYKIEKLAGAVGKLYNDYTLTTHDTDVDDPIYRTQTSDMNFSIPAGGIEAVVAYEGGGTLTKKIIGSGTLHSVTRTTHSGITPSTYFGDTDYSSDYAEVYIHEDEFGSFEVCRASLILSAQKNLEGTDGETTLNTESAIENRCIIIFTHIDAKNGIYAYYEYRPFINCDVSKLRESTAAGMPYYYSNYPISWKHFVTHRGGSSLLYLMTATIPYGFTEFLSDAQIQTIAALWNLAYYPWNGYDAVYSNAFCNLGVTNTGTYSFSYDAMQTWWWNTDNVHAEGGSGLPEQSEYANWPDFQGTPFTSDKWHKRPYMRNIGTPHIGSPTINFPEYCYAPGAVLWSDNGIVRSGLSYGLGQYSFIYTLNSTSVTIESPELPDILSCTGRDDLVLTNT